MSRWDGSKQYRENRKLLLAYSPSCALCGGPGATTVDHIIPRAKGGTHDLSNLRPAHLKCNSSRKDRMRDRYQADW